MLSNGECSRHPFLLSETSALLMLNKMMQYAEFYFIK
uniref:Uncharacterized protein n=1 Tax=Siphoviridae sp. ctNDP2 TaxID=2826265 RepID=A0A8S5NE94_9CAUD|nr:MAG TPA: hypothetical protein [Siphoviridae sp. ctNDP2]